MFRRLREKIERALESREAARALSREELDDLLHAMRKELIDLRARTARVEKEVAQLDSKAQDSVRRAEHAHRLAQDAKAAGREDEARGAMEATERALRQAEDLKRQAIEAHADLAEMTAEAADKLEKLKEAQRNRHAILARSRRAKTSQRLEEAMRGPESGIRRFEQAEEDLAAAEDLVAATKEVEEALGGPTVPVETDYELRRLEQADEMADIERRLAELKREVEGEGE